MPQTIRFTITGCSLGLALVASTEKGICCVLFGDHADVLEAELRDRFPQAQMLQEDCARADVVTYIERPVTNADFTLDVHGTPFQKRVWEALRRIPFGKTATYADVAREIHAPSSMRAVAQACGANPISVLIPCHRVVRRDGSLSGYRWGVERKKALLAREGVSAL